MAQNLLSNSQGENRLQNLIRFGSCFVETRSICWAFLANQAAFQIDDAFGHRVNFAKFGSRCQPRNPPSYTSLALKLANVIYVHDTRTAPASPIQDAIAEPFSV